MSALPDKPLTTDDYLALERASEVKHEFVDGETHAMTGASRKHNLITGNLVTQFNLQLSERPCEVFANDMRVRIQGTTDYVYPDVVVVCGEPHFEDAEIDTLLNPTLIVEVLSPSTELYDRGKKFQRYQRLSSLREYLLVTQNSRRVEHYARQADDRWLYMALTSEDDPLDLPSIGCVLTLAQIYAKVALNVD